MTRNDLFSLCLLNLRRRKARTFLTVLGVVVGCCSIVIMVSIGVGMRESQEKMLSEMGDLAIINVYPPGGKKKLDQKILGEIRQLPGVETVSPKAGLGNISFRLYAGENRRYLSEYAEVAGMEPQAAEQLGYRLKEGDLFTGKPFAIVVGEDFAYSFADTKRPEGKNMITPWGGGGDEFSGDGEMDAVMASPEAGKTAKPAPWFDPMKTKLILELEVGDKGKKLTQELTVVGRLKEDYGKGSETSQGAVLRLQDLEQLLERYRQESGGKRVEKSYPSALVKVSSIQQVGEVEERIRSLGMRTSSMESIRKPMEKEARQKQLMLGGIGAISLLVAALGITNTMIMSISERTREIGVMKALGCFVSDVRSIFLMEAGCIGLLGGVAGVIISLITSVVMNLVSAQQPFLSFWEMVQYLFTPGSRLSVVPLWLVLFALAFSVAIGLGAGYYPANRAVKISALEAIKHE